ncbi:putative sensor domain DACNV-containing protein [Desulfogranum mediterraneum]|uniref:putative sensor domain DACNV-containing protein n=1 Tax=Desulfogranum mediterraneum TaxID=160661 RepID=UPI00040A1FC4|nr:hypothetical protein [Desulfogranum mediterraneum]
MHVYPSELVPLIMEKWEGAQSGKEPPLPQPAHGLLPDQKAMEDMFSTCYQVSMMREEDRPVNIRLIILPPEAFPAGKGPPSGFQRLVFSSPRPFNEYELRRLSPALDFERSLIGVEYNEQSEFQIWGIINSGIRWLQGERGGAKKPNQLPDSLVVQVNGPGMLTVCRGIRPLAVLSGGRIVDSSANVFQSLWMKKLFADTREELLAAHESFRREADYPVARIDEEFIGILQFEILKRLISVTKMAQHGGTFIIFPEDVPASFYDDNPHIQLKYRFLEDQAITRQLSLLQKTIATATTLLADADDPDLLISWSDYVGLRHQSTDDLEEAFYEQVQFVASLAAVDGAVVVTKSGAVGFGGMIVGSLDQLTEVAIANDIEGKMVTLEKIEGSGSRHRSAYHLCNALHQVMAIVVSQDGSVQLAKWRNGIVTCWDLTSSSFTEEIELVL